MALAEGDGKVRRGKSGGITAWGAEDGDGIPLKRKQGDEGALLLIGTTATTHNLLRVERDAQQSLPGHMFGQWIVVRCFFGSI